MTHRLTQIQPPRSRRGGLKRYGASLSPDTAMRPYRRSSSAHKGDVVCNRYHLTGLVDRIRKLEPDFAKEAAAKTTWRNARTDAELSPHRRRKKPAMGP